MDTSLWNIINENVEQVRQGLSSSRQEATEFLEVCESSGWKPAVKNPLTGAEVDWRDCPDDVVIQLALIMFEHFRQRTLH